MKKHGLDIVLKLNQMDHNKTKVAFTGQGAVYLMEFLNEEIENILEKEKLKWSLEMSILEQEKLELNIDR